MFSVFQKQSISHAVQKILRSTGHPELPEGEISFNLHVDGAESWSWADIENNGAVEAPGVNPFNEAQAARSYDPALVRELINMNKQLLTHGGWNDRDAEELLTKLEASHEPDA